MTDDSNAVELSAPQSREQVLLELAKLERDFQTLQPKTPVVLLLDDDDPGHWVAFDLYRGEWRLLEVHQIPGLDGAHSERPLSDAPHEFRARALRLLPRLFERASIPPPGLT